MSDLEKMDSDVHVWRRIAHILVAMKNCTVAGMVRGEDDALLIKEGLDMLGSSGMNDTERAGVLGVLHKTFTYQPRGEESRAALEGWIGELGEEDLARMLMIAHARFDKVLELNWLYQHDHGILRGRETLWVTPWAIMEHGKVLHRWSQSDPNFVIVGPALAAYQSVAYADSTYEEIVAAVDSALALLGSEEVRGGT